MFNVTSPVFEVDTFCICPDCRTVYESRPGWYSDGARLEVDTGCPNCGCEIEEACICAECGEVIPLSERNINAEGKTVCDICALSAETTDSLAKLLFGGADGCL